MSPPEPHLAALKVCVLIPAYNCAHIIEEVVRRIPLSGPDDELIVVDDASSDNTVEVAARFPRVYAVRNPANLGYGGTSQRLYELALERGADLTIHIHGDLGHRPEDVPAVLEPVRSRKFDVALGSRLLYLSNVRKASGWLALRSPEVRQGMPFSRILGHFGLTWFQNCCFNTNLHSFHDGMRACGRAAIEWAVQSRFSTWYNYDTDFLLHAHRAGFRIGEVPVRPFYLNKPNSSAPSLRYGLRVVRYTLQNMRQRKTSVPSVKSARNEQASG